MASVRIFGYSGMVQIQQSLVKQFNADSVFLRQEPYLWSQVIALNGATPVESVVQANDKATFVVVEVDKLSAARYEVNPTGPTGTGHRNAGTASPRVEGEAPFQWFAGATMSFVDAASV